MAFYNSPPISGQRNWMVSRVKRFSKSFSILNSNHESVDGEMGIFIVVGSMMKIAIDVPLQTVPMEGGDLSRI